MVNVNARSVSNHAVIVVTVPVAALTPRPSLPIPAKPASESFHSPISELAGQTPLLPQGICILPLATLSSVRCLGALLFLSKPLESRRRRGEALLRRCGNVSIREKMKGKREYNLIPTTPASAICSFSSSTASNSAGATWNPFTLISSYLSS